ncbi:hypothetical protein [Cryptosporangium sp. NPDC048952]|uniref:hypothetical protein n=1 Tax=Cryptosporangium sp. NPDC048952 TaxID=3363961 RepID=UPI003712A80F
MVAKTLVGVVDSIIAREGSHGFLDSVKDLAGAGEPEFALDFLADGLLSWKLPITPSELAILEELCRSWNAEDRIRDFAILTQP